MSYLLTLLQAAGILFVGMIVFLGLAIAGFAVIHSLAQSLADVVKPKDED